MITVSIAPDLPGFGFTEVPAERKYAYSFDRVGQDNRCVHGSAQIDRYAIYVFDYGAPTGFRLAMAHPQRVAADHFAERERLRRRLELGLESDPEILEGPTAQNRAALHEFLTPEATKWQYTHGVSGSRKLFRPSRTHWMRLCWHVRGIKTVNWICFSITRRTSSSTRNSRNISVNRSRLCWRSGARTILFSFLPEPRRIRRDLPNAKVQFLDTGHFALETHVVEIAAAIKVLSCRERYGGAIAQKVWFRDDAVSQEKLIGTRGQYGTS